MDNESTQHTPGTVVVVEDDASLRSAIALALEVRSINHLDFANASDVLTFLDDSPVTTPTCVLLDIRLGSGPSGLSVFDKITELGLTARVPVVFMTGHGDLETAVEVMRLGAFDFVTKPFSTADLVKKIESALVESATANRHAIEAERISALTGQLTAKGREVMELMVVGKTNREIAEICGNSTRTVELHRARVFDKLRVSNAVELVQVLGSLEK